MKRKLNDPESGNGTAPDKESEEDGGDGAPSPSRSREAEAATTTTTTTTTAALSPSATAAAAGVGTAPTGSGSGSGSGGGVPLLQQTRSSARVLRKKEERKESVGEASSASADAEVAAAEIDGGGGDGGEPGEGGSDVGGCALAGDVDGVNAPRAAVKKPRRTWEQWSTEDMNIFFEALNEFGKNFDSIQSHFQSKAAMAKSKKNKEQIRTFYYRTWHKISKYIQFPEQLKKSSQELYALINFGELRKKTGITVDEKKGAKLQELVFYGHTTVRSRGKTYRLRTPICRALKRLNSKLDVGKAAGMEGGGPTELPSHLVLNLKPMKDDDFYRVHSDCFQNPHIRLRVNPQRRLASVIEFLERKWTPPENKLQDTFKRSASSQSASTPSPVGKELWLMTKSGTKLSTPVVTSVQPVTSSTLSLSSLQEKMRKKGQAEERREECSSNPASVDGGTRKLSEEVEAPRTVEKSSASDVVAVKEHIVEPGWNKAMAERLTTGGLFLMLGISEATRIELYYTWLPASQDLTSGDNQAEAGVKEEPQLPGVSLKNTTSTPAKVVIPPNGDYSATAVLSRLANSELAKLQQQKVTSTLSPQKSATLTTPTATPAGAQNSAATAANHLRIRVSSEAPQAQGSSKMAMVMSSSSPSMKGSSDGAASEFRRPAPVPPMRSGASATGQSAHSDAFKKQVIQMLPKYTNRRGRSPMSRKTVMSRQLASSRPVQPKNLINISSSKAKIILAQAGSGSSAPAQVLWDGGGVAARHHQVLTAFQSQMSVVNVPSALHGTNAGTPSSATLVNGSHKATTPLILPSSTSTNSGSDADRSSTIAPLANAASLPQLGSSTQLANGPSSPAGSLSSLFDNSFSDLASGGGGGGGGGAHAEEPPTKCDRFLDSVLENSNSSVLQTPPRQRPTPPSSPSRAVSGEPSWLLPGDMTLSSFLNLAGESPAKGSSSAGGPGGGGGGAICVNEDSSHSTGSEVDRNIISMMTENSVDFTNKFAKLASHVNDGD